MKPGSTIERLPSPNAIWISFVTGKHGSERALTTPIFIHEPKEA